VSSYKKVWQWRDFCASALPVGLVGFGGKEKRLPGQFVVVEPKSNEHPLHIFYFSGFIAEFGINNRVDPCPTDAPAQLDLRPIRPVGIVFENIKDDVRIDEDAIRVNHPHAALS